MSGIYNNVTELVGRTPLVRLNRLTEGLGAQVVVEARVLQPGQQRQGPDRRGDHRRRREVRCAEARRHHRRGHQWQHRHRTRHGRRGPRLQGHPHDARDDVHRASRHAARVRRRDRADPGRRGHGRCGREGRGDRRRRPRTLSPPASSRTPPTRRSTRRPPARRSGPTPTATSTSSSPASAPAAPSPASAHVLKARKPDVQIVGVEPARLADPQRRPARPAQDPGHRRELRARGPRSRDLRRDHRRRRSTTPSGSPAASAPRRASSAASRPAPSCGPHSSWRSVPRTPAS